MPSLPSLHSPTDNNLYSSSNTSYPTPMDNNSLESSEKEEIKFTPDYKARESIFLHVFKELSNDNKLQERLVSTGKFYVGEAVLMIDHMEKIGKIEHTGDYHIYRIRKSISPEEQGGRL
jgi:hypothetical protein